MALRKKPPTTLLLTDMSSLYGYIYCMLISEGLSGMPLYGGALYMIGRVTTVFAQTFSPEEAIYLPKALRWMRIPLMILLLLLSLCLVVLYPMSFGSTQMWLIFSVVLSMQLRDSLCQRMGRLCLDGRMEQTTFLATGNASLELPDPGGLVVGDGDQPSAVGRDRDAPDRPGMRAQFDAKLGRRGLSRLSCPGRPGRHRFEREPGRAGQHDGDRTDQ